MKYQCHLGNQTFLMLNLESFFLALFIMLDANDLRLNNWFFTNEGYPIKAEDFDVLQWITRNGEPIPLTFELLERANLSFFHPQLNDQNNFLLSSVITGHVGQKIEIDFDLIAHSETSLNSKKYRIHLTYLQELQNVYKILIGLELEINMSGYKQGR
jgi:hypothetical protein